MSEDRLLFHLRYIFADISRSSVKSDVCLYLRLETSPVLYFCPIMSASNIQTPTYMSGQNYELFKKEIKIWAKVTSVKEEARGMHILLNLPNQDKDPNGVKSKILEAFSFYMTLWF